MNAWPFYWQWFLYLPSLPGAQRDRNLAELISGKHVNVHIVPTRKEWENNVLTIPIPILKGLLGYRLFLIKSQDRERFAHVKPWRISKRSEQGSCLSVRNFQNWPNVLRPV